METNAMIGSLREEIAVLEEGRCHDCPRTQEILSQESTIARRRLRLIALEYRRRDLEEELGVLIRRP